MIKFNKACFCSEESEFVNQSILSRKISGDGKFTKKCQTWFEDYLKTKKTLLTTSCTHALEMCAILLDIKAGDEVIMPSYTFVSSANAFVLRGAKIVFVDIRPDTMNINEKKIESAITEKTKAVLVVHYAGVACEMDKIMSIAKKYNLFVVEDAAQGMMSSYKDKALGTIGDLGAFSFHETKNYTSAGEGGLLIINNQKFSDRAEIIREKGTNRSLFFRGMIDKYSWVDLGSSYLMNDISAAYLWGQIINVDKINNQRLASWNFYWKELNLKEFNTKYDLPKIPNDCRHNAHMFYLKLNNLESRTKLINFLKDCGIEAVFHYVPLHSTVAGINFGRFHGKDTYTTIESEKIIRLPMYYDIDKKTQLKIVSAIKDFFRKA